MLSNNSVTLSKNDCDDLTEISNAAKSHKMIDPMADFVLTRTYARNIYDANGDALGKESKDDIFMRVTLGTFSLLEEHLRMNHDYIKYKDIIPKLVKQFYSALWNKYITPPGRGLWVMGTDMINVHRLGFSLYNCTFITSGNIDVIGSEFFRFVMDVLMVGVGVGFDTKGSGKRLVNMPCDANYLYYNNYYLLVDQLKQFRDEKFTNNNGISYIDHEIDHLTNLEIAHQHRYRVHKISDSREGWCDALCMLVDSYFKPGEYFVAFDYSGIRPEGTPLKRFGGKASGPKPLAEMIAAIRYLLHDKYLGHTIDELFIIDVCNIIARTVVAGNVRRSSEICLSDTENINRCKLYSEPEFSYRSNWGWASNNSYCIEDDITHEQLNRIMESINRSAEPGLFFKNNARKYGRMIDGLLKVEDDVDGVNPCGEISLKGTDLRTASAVPYSAGGEPCNLVETIPSNYGYQFVTMDINWELMFNALHDVDLRKSKDYSINESLLRISIKEYLGDLYIAHLYAKIVTTIPLHWKSSQHIQSKYRRLGISITGIAVLLSQLGIMDDSDASNIECLWDNMKNEKSITFKRFAVVLDLAARVVDENDESISRMMRIPKSVKKRTVKPSGTISICNGVPSGMHFPYSRYYKRRVRVNTCEKELIESYRSAGYTIENVKANPNTVAISFPIRMKEDVMARDEVPIDLQFKILLYLQYYWSDNQVSCTLTFKEHERDRIEKLIYNFRHLIKGVSCNPYYDTDKALDNAVKAKTNSGKTEKEAKAEIYDCLPNERITESEYKQMISVLKPVKSNNISTDEVESDMYCDGDSCVRITTKH